MKWNFTSLGLTNTYFSARININVAFPTTYMQPFPLVPHISLLCKNNNYVKKQQKNSCRDKDKKNLNTKVVGKRWRLLKSNGELWTNINEQETRKKTRNQWRSHIPHHVKLLNIFVIVTQMKMTCEMWCCTYNNKATLHKILPNLNQN